MNEILIAEGAERDFVDSLVWYAERSKRAAEGFQAEIEWALDRIAENPEMFPFCDERHRFLLLRRYPFQVIYRAIDEICSSRFRPYESSPRLLVEPLIPIPTAILKRAEGDE